MSAPTAPKFEPPNITYVWNKRKIYTDAIKKLNKAEAIFVAPINYVDKMDATKTIPSLIYMCTWDNVFIFDLIAFKEKAITKELEDILKSNKMKFILSKRITFNFLGFDNWDQIPNVFDIASPGDHFSSFDGANKEDKESEASGTTPNKEFRLCAVDWSARPFTAEEHFKAGRRIYELMMMFTEYKL
nr:uncharacterized protein LOC111414635 [Onthophagus taurus]